MTFCQNARPPQGSRNKLRIVRRTFVQFPSRVCWIGAELAAKVCELIDEGENKLYQCLLIH